VGKYYTKGTWNLSVLGQRVEQVGRYALKGGESTGKMNLI